jgi:hypothetical protein
VELLVLAAAAQAPTGHRVVWVPANLSKRVKDILHLALVPVYALQASG